MNKTICIYHKNCFDGICAAWVTNKRFPNCELVPMGYGDPFIVDPNIVEETRYIFVDFSLKRETTLFLADRCESILIVDHHKTAEAELKDLNHSRVTIKFDMNESGASLAWKYFFPIAPVPNLVRYIADRDLWKFKEDNSETINAFIQSFPMNIHEYEMLYHNLELDTGMLEAQLGGTAINRYKQTMVEAICKTAAFNVGAFSGMLWEKERVPVVNTSLLFSEVGHELCKLYPNAHFAAYYYDRRMDNVRQWGLRSIGDFDVSVVAKQFGGGGHFHAAGFEQKLSEL